jgi:integrase
LAFNKTVVTRYRISLEQAHCASSTINLRLAAVRRLAYEAADAGLLSPDLAAGIRRVKGAKKFGVRVGNWLTAEQGKRLLSVFDRQTLRGIRDYAMTAVLLGCGLRRAEVAGLSVQDLQQREEHYDRGYRFLCHSSMLTFSEMPAVLFGVAWLAEGAARSLS